MYKPNGDHTWGLFTAVPGAFIIVINSLDSPDNMLTNNEIYPWHTSVGKDKHSLSIGLSIGTTKFKHERNAIMQHQPCHGTMHQTSNYIRSGFLLNLLWVKTLGEKFKFTTPGASWLHTRSTRSGSLLPKTQPVCQSLLHVSTASWTLCRTYSFMHEVRSCSFLWAVLAFQVNLMDCSLFFLLISRSWFANFSNSSSQVSNTAVHLCMIWLENEFVWHECMSCKPCIYNLNQGLAHTNSVTHIGHHCPLIYSTTASHINTFTE